MSDFRSWAIIPAAGRSSRMGFHKLLAKWHDQPLIDHLLAAFAAASVTRTVVVVRSDDELLANHCRRLKVDLKVDLVVPDVPPVDMRASVQLGLQHVADRYTPRAYDTWLVAPADLPRISPRITRRLLTAYAEAEPTIVAPVVNGRRGHPVLFPWSMATAVQSLGPTEGINLLLRSQTIHEVDCEDASSFDDVDTPEDLARLSRDNPPVSR